MSNRSYVIVLSEQTFIHSWRISLQTFVNYASNKRAPCERSEPNRIFNRTNPLIVAKIKDYENCTHAKFAQFSNNWQRFFPTHVCDTSCQLLTHAHRKLIKVGHSSRCALTRSRSSKPPSRHGRASACLSRNIWTVTHMSSQQLATLNCFHCVNKVSYS